MLCLSTLAFALFRIPIKRPMQTFILDKQRILFHNQCSNTFPDYFAIHLYKKLHLMKLPIRTKLGLFFALSVATKDRSRAPIKSRPVRIYNIKKAPCKDNPSRYLITYGSTWFNNWKHNLTSPPHSWTSERLCSQSTVERIWSWVVSLFNAQRSPVGL